MIKIYTFLTTVFERDSRCNRITLRATKALRVMCNTNSWGWAPSRRSAPGRAAQTGPHSWSWRFSKMLVHHADLSIKRYFSKTHRQTQRIHSWIAFDLRKVGKLIRCQTNSWKFRFLNFRDQNLRKILDHSWRRFSLDPNYSKSREGSTSHVKRIQGFWVMTIFLVKKYGKSWAKFDVICHCRGITLRAEKALRVIW